MNYKNPRKINLYTNKEKKVSYDKKKNILNVSKKI